MKKRDRIRQLETELAMRDQALDDVKTARDVALDRIESLIETRNRVMAERDAARDQAADMGQGILAIHGERLTHTTEHNYDAEHDDEFHTAGQLARAAACYAAPVAIYEARHSEDDDRYLFIELWPWEPEEDRRHRRAEGLLPAEAKLREERIHELAKAGSLIAAEIERLLRLGGSEIHRVYRQGPVPVEEGE